MNIIRTWISWCDSFVRRRYVWERILEGWRLRFRSFIGFRSLRGSLFRNTANGFVSLGILRVISFENLWGQKRWTVSEWGSEIRTKKGYIKPRKTQRTKKGRGRIVQKGCTTGESKRKLSSWAGRVGGVTAKREGIKTAPAFQQACTSSSDVAAKTRVYLYRYLTYSHHEDTRRCNPLCHRGGRWVFLQHDKQTKDQQI